MSHLLLRAEGVLDLPSHHDLGVEGGIEGEDEASYGRVEDVQAPASEGYVAKMIFNSVFFYLRDLSIFFRVLETYLRF